MGDIRNVSPVLLFVAAFAAEEESLAWGRTQCEKSFGAIQLEGDVYQVGDYTDYYARSMGGVLRKRFWAMRDLIDPARLPEIKRMTNEWESRCPVPENAVFPRSLNLDPGYVDLGKLILASTKDHAHRIYLRDGIFAETTLMYTRKSWQPLPWTYPDYQSEIAHRFLDRCRAYLVTVRSDSTYR